MRDEHIIRKRLQFECPKCKDWKVYFYLTYEYCNGYGELACPVCFSHELKVIITEFIHK